MIHRDNSFKAPYFATLVTPQTLHYMCAMYDKLKLQQLSFSFIEVKPVLSKYIYIILKSTKKIERISKQLHSLFKRGLYSIANKEIPYRHH